MADVPLANWPVRRPTDWLTRVNRVLAADQLDQLRESVQRGRPLGEADWVASTAKRLGLEHTLRSPGRPKRINQ